MQEGTSSAPLSSLLPLKEGSLLREKLHLVWMLRYVQPKVSFNILRLICAEFLGASLNLVIFTPTQLCLQYASTHNEWLTVYSHSLAFPGRSHVSVTYLGGTSVFLCGLGSRGKGMVLMNAGQIELETRTKFFHRGAGVVHEPRLKSVFMFGDLGFAYCEQFFLSSSVLRQLPCMSSPRSLFNPCVFRELIYLCGGGYCRSVESYDPRKNTFQLASEFVLESGLNYKFSVCAVYRDSLVVVNQTHVGRLGKKGWDITKLNTPLKVSLTSQCAPVVFDGRLFLADTLCKTIVELDLESIVVLSQTPISCL